VGPIQPLRHRVPWALSLEIEGWKFAGGHHPPPLSSRLRMSCAVPLLPFACHGVYRGSFTLLYPLPAIRMWDLVSTSPFIVNGWLQGYHFYSRFRKKLNNRNGCWYILRHSFFCNSFMAKIKETRKYYACALQLQLCFEQFNYYYELCGSVLRAAQKHRQLRKEKTFFLVHCYLCVCLLLNVVVFTV
jgi:hypothetical protein